MKSTLKEIEAEQFASSKYKDARMQIVSKENPGFPAKPVWVKIKEPELKEIIAELAKKHSPSQIGIILRDQYGIPTTKVFGKKLKPYLKELKIDRNEDLENAEKKVNTLKDHLKRNITDKKAKHKLQKAQSRLNITNKYFEKKHKKSR